MSLAVYERITNTIIAQLEQGTVPWHKPWNATQAGELQNLFSGHVYQGVNVLLLGMQPYQSPFWATFLQVKQHGGTVRKGEHGTLIIKVGRYSRTDDQGEDTTGQYLKTYVVFNHAQLEGIPAPCKLHDDVRAFAPIARCAQLVKDIVNPPVIRHGSPLAYYRASADVLSMPDAALFEPPEEYYSTIFHELVHSTGHATRLGRDTLKEASSFGSVNYSKEELIAEMGAAFLCGVTGIETATIANSAAYISGWLRRLRSDTTLLVSAAAQGQRAANWLTGRQPGASPG